MKKIKDWEYVSHQAVGIPTLKFGLVSPDAVFVPKNTKKTSVLFKSNRASSSLIRKVYHRPVVVSVVADLVNSDSCVDMVLDGLGRKMVYVGISPLSKSRGLSYGRALYSANLLGLIDVSGFLAEAKKLGFSIGPHEFDPYTCEMFVSVSRFSNLNSLDMSIINKPFTLQEELITIAWLEEVTEVPLVVNSFLSPVEWERKRDEFSEADGAFWEVENTRDCTMDLISHERLLSHGEVLVYKVSVALLGEYEDQIELDLAFGEINEKTSKISVGIEDIQMED